MVVCIGLYVHRFLLQCKTQISDVLHIISSTRDVMKLFLAALYVSLNDDGPYTLL